VRRHHWIVRLTHWATALLLAGMIASGLQIFEAYARFGDRGGPFYPGALAMMQYYVRLRREHPPQGKHNPLQKLAYTSIYLFGVLSVLTGFAIYKPVQLGWLTALFGGFQGARWWHNLMVWIFVGFTIVHVVLVFAVDPASLRAMLTGEYRGRFPSHD
jgi:Ni,Fe-hydrogenase I cytochrome b subunit